MKKLFLAFIFVSCSILVSAEFNGAEIVRKMDGTAVEKTFNRFKHLRPSETQISDAAKPFEKMKVQKPNIEQQLKQAVKIYQGDKTFSKKEFEKVVKNVLLARKIANETRNAEFILILYSMSMPREYLKNILIDIGILQENGIRVLTKQYLVGFPEDMDFFKDYLLGFEEYVRSLTPKERAYIGDNFALKVDPRLFKLTKTKKVPVVIHGFCRGRKPSKESCKFDYIMRGDASLTEFFDKISEKDPRYRKYYEVLVGNKLIHKQPKEGL